MSNRARGEGKINTASSQSSSRHITRFGGIHILNQHPASLMLDSLHTFGSIIACSCQDYGKGTLSVAACH
jgi:hypothetical protein